MSQKTATTVKIEKGLYDDFKVLSIRQHKQTLQTFVEKCVHLYVTDDPFRKIVDGFVVPLLSHSGSVSGSFGS